MDQFLFLSNLPKTFLYSKNLSSTFEKEPASIDDIVRALKNHPKFTESVVHQAKQNLAKQLQIMHSHEIQFTHWWSHSYPRSLREIPYSPLVLFYKGNLSTNSPCLGIIGTRNPDEYGKTCIAKLLSEIKTRPIELVSGLASGIDSYAHFYSTDLRFPNFGVCGHGLDQIYPRENLRLVEKMLSVGGGILSEFPPLAAPIARNFPWRNRIISGLSDVLWVVQGTFYSGTKHSIQFACKQNKTIAATPGDIFNPLSEITNQLILDGAHPILQASDLDLLLSPFTYSKKSL